MNYEGITITQGAFLCCLFVFGPAFGFLAVYRHVTSRIGGVWSFLFECFAAYSGWFISGVAGMLMFPDYGTSAGPSEAVAILFTLPGFLTAWMGLRVLRVFADRVPAVKGIPNHTPDGIRQPADGSPKPSM